MMFRFANHYTTVTIWLLSGGLSQSPNPAAIVENFCANTCSTVLSRGGLYLILPVTTQQRRFDPTHHRKDQVALASPFCLLSTPYQPLSYALLHGLRRSIRESNLPLHSLIGSERP